MTIYGSTNVDGWTYKLDVTETSTSIVNRTSTIQVIAYLGRSNSTSYIGGSWTGDITVAGQTQSMNGTIPFPTYINGGSWYALATKTFTVSNTGNPTIISILSNWIPEAGVSPSYGGASGTMQLTVLHLSPVIETAEMEETDASMIALNIPDTTIVRHLSKKKITLHGTTYDEATLTYRLEHFGTAYNIPTTGYQASNIFNTDYTTNDISIDSNNKASIVQKLADSLNGTATDWLYVDIGGTPQKPNAIPYAKPSLVGTSTTIKRKSGNGTNLTDNKANLNLVGTIYKANDIIGNDNAITQIGYKIWEDGTLEPANYTSLTPTISSGDVTVTNYEITNVDFTKIYNYKIKLADKYYNYEIEGTVPLGQATWSEYKDRVDFLKLTVGGYNPFEYSTSETVCGIWNDGYDEKPIYRKIVTFTTSSSDVTGWTDATQISDNVDDIINIYGYTLFGNNKTPLPRYESPSYYVIFLAIGNILKYRCVGFHSAECNLVVEYTKTTD